MKIENKTNEEIRAHIIKMSDSYNKTGKDLYLKIKEECEAELQRRAQKKSVEQRREQENKAAFFEERREKAKENKPEKIRELSGSYQGEKRVIARIENPEPVAVPVVEMEFKDAKGNTYTRALDQSDIISLLKTYFKRVAVSPKMEAKRYSEAYGSDMGKMVYKLFQGWNMIYNETKEGAAWPPLEDVFPGLSRASQQHKVNADVLWRWASNDK